MPGPIVSRPLLRNTQASIAGVVATLTVSALLTIGGLLNFPNGIANTILFLDGSKNASTTNQIVIDGNSGNVTTTGSLVANSIQTNIASFTTATVAGQGICLSNGQFCSSVPAGGSDTLASVTNRGAFATSSVTLFGGLFVSNISATGTLTVAASSSLANVTFANATATGSLYVGSQRVCLANGTDCPAGSGSDTLLTVSNRGSVATSTLFLFGGFIAGSSTVTSTFNVTGNTLLQSTTATNLFASSAFFTNATTTGYFGFNQASGVSIGINSLAFGAGTGGSLAVSASLTVGGQNVCLVDGTNCPAGVGGTDTLQSVTNRGSFTTTTAQFFGGFVAASSSVTGTFNVVGNTTLLNTTGTSLYISGRTSSTIIQAERTTTTRLFLGDGALVRPSLAFDLEHNLGFYRSSAGVMSHVSGGATRFEISSSIITNYLPLVPNVNGGQSIGTVANRFGLGSFAAVTSTFVTTTNLYLSRTYIAGGTIGGATTNAACGSVNFAIGAGSLHVTNTAMTASTTVMATLATDDTTMTSIVAVPNNGFLRLVAKPAAPSAETRVNYCILAR